MPKKKQQFIDKKHALTFTLAERPTNDPLLDVETAPQNVLALTSAGADTKDEKAENLKTQLQSFGIYYEDDYDYMQHLRGCDDSETGTKSENRVMLPAEAFSFLVEPTENDDVYDMEQFFDAELDEEMLQDEQEIGADGGELEDNFVEIAEEIDREEVSALDDNKTDLMRRFLGHRIYDEEEEEESVASGQFSDASEEDEESMEQFLAKEAAYLGRPLTVKEEVELRQYHDMLNDLQHEVEVTDVDAQSAGGQSVCSLATKHAMDRDKATLFSREILTLEAAPDERDELMLVTQRLLQLQEQEGSEDDCDPVEEWANRDRRVELQHDINSFHLHKSKESLRKARSCRNHNDISLVPNAVEGDDGLVLKGSAAISRLSQSSVRLLSQTETVPPAPAPAVADLTESRKPRKRDETLEEKKIRKQAVRLAKKDRLANKKERRETFDEIRQSRCSAPAPGSSGVKCRTVPIL